MEQVSPLPGPQFPHVIDEACGRSSRVFYYREAGTGQEGRAGSDPPARQPGSGYRAGARTAPPSRPCCSRHRSCRAQTWSPWPSTAAAAPGGQDGDDDDEW